MKTTQIGRDAEEVAAEHLKRQGYEIVAQNWRTRWCEIDIIATKNKTVYFVEVKYRKSSVWGDGLDAITDKKLEQMSFAAEMWVHAENWAGDYSLAAMSLSGVPPTVDVFTLV